MQHGVTLKGRVTIRLYDKDGDLRDAREIENLVVTAGKGVIADRMKAVPTKAAITHMAIGTGTTAPDAANTTLQSETARQALTSTNVAGAVITYAASFAAGVATGTITEAGLLNAPAAGDMLARTTFTGIVKGASDSMTVTWNVTIS